MFNAQLEIWDMLLRLFAASACGMAIGWERERKDKPAGLRTHTMVAIGAAGFTLITWNLCAQLSAVQGNVRLDPLRSVAGIIGGIGFLGAGAIIQSQGAIRGITTAAAIWVAGTLGVACGFGYYTIALLIVTISLLVLYPLGHLEYHVLTNNKDTDRQAGNRDEVD